ncbi:MAG TPA: hypothetical protein PL029_02460 [Bacteroidia bacterium]|nr:hypothetical protein [Bacteroidia bacterium]
MKITQYFFFLYFLLILNGLRAQKGLEGLIVEKYYISDANDTIHGRYNGFLPVGSTCYRIYLDMLPGYRFQAAYGTTEHELRIETSTTFFNNWDMGNKSPDVIPYRTLVRNTIMLDSWLSAGVAGEGVYGVLKEQDDTIETIIHEKPFFQSANKLAGIPVKERDGLMFGNNLPHTIFYGIEDSLQIFHKASRSVFSTRNGAWACLTGAVGADSLTTNRVLIAQLTTNGELKCKLNIQIGTRDGIVENYVASDPVEKEILAPFLTYSSAVRNPLSAGTKQTSNKK